MAGHGHRFARFADQARGQNVPRAKPASQGARQPRGNANVGPVGKNPPRGFERVGLPHARQNRADPRAAEFRFKDRPFARQAAKIPAPLPRREFRLNRKCHQYIHGLRHSIMPHARAQLPARPWRQHIRSLRTSATARSSAASIGPATKPSSRTAFDASTNILCRAMRTPSSGICGSRPISRETAVSTYPAA